LKKISGNLNAQLGCTTLVEYRVASQDKTIIRGICLR